MKLITVVNDLLTKRKEKTSKNNEREYRILEHTHYDYMDDKTTITYFVQMTCHHLFFFKRWAYIAIVQWSKTDWRNKISFNKIEDAEDYIRILRKNEELKKINF